MQLPAQIDQMNLIQENIFHPNPRPKTSKVVRSLKMSDNQVPRSMFKSESHSKFMLGDRKTIGKE